MLLRWLKHIVLAPLRLLIDRHKKEPAQHSWFLKKTGQQNIIVFIHGLTGNAISTWMNDSTGAYWPDLIAQDPDFQSYDIYVVAYESPRISTASSIVEIATRILSDMNDHGIFNGYQQISFITHSMGGLIAKRILVVLNRPTESEKLRKVRAVLYISTPAQGSELAELASWLSLNPQFVDLKSADFNTFLQSLENDWQNLLLDRPEGREQSPRAFCAYETQARGPIMIVSRVYATTGCDANPYPVDRDHIQIVKPAGVLDPPYPWAKQRILDSSLRGVSPKPSRELHPTPFGKIGIWVARIDGDGESHSAQRSIARHLEFHIVQEPSLIDRVEVREVPEAIIGSTLMEKEASVQELGKQQNASIIVWGELAGLFSPNEFHPRVTLVKRHGLNSKTAVLSPIMEHGKLSPPPETASLPPQPFQEPLQLARFLLGLTFLEQEKWADAASQFNTFIAQGTSPALSMGDTYYYVGYSNNQLHEFTGLPEPLTAARDAYRHALVAFENEKNWSGFAATQSNLGATYQVLAERKIEPEQNLANSVEALQEAARLRKEQQNWGDYAMAQNNLGLTYRTLAAWEIEPEQNLANSVEALQEAARLWKEQQDWMDYAMAQNNLGLTYRALAMLEIEPEQNLAFSIEALQEAARLWKQQQNWVSYAGSQNNLGLAYRALAEWGIEPEQNLGHSVEVLQEAVLLWKEQQNWMGYPMAQNNLGGTYLALAMWEIAPEKCLTHSVEVFQEAARLWKQQQNWVSYAWSQNNLGLAYRALAERGIEPEQNLKRAESAIEEGARSGTQARP